MYIGCFDSRLYALKGGTGDVLWSTDIGAPIDVAPAIGPDDTVYVSSSSGHILALNGETGETVWRYYLRGTSVTDPAIGVDGTLYFGAADGSLHALACAGSGRLGGSLCDAS